MNILGKGSSGDVILIEKDGKKYARKKIISDVSGLTSLLEIIFGYGSQNTYVGSIENIEFNDEERSVYIFSEYAPYTANTFYRRKTSISIEEIKELTVCLIKGLQYIHSYHVIHRDIKPSNILIYPIIHCDKKSYIPKIIDFGLSVQTKIAKGKSYTTNYRPPEVWDNKEYDSSADIWALGCTLYEIYHSYPLFPISKLWERNKIFNEGINKLKNSKDSFDNFLLYFIAILPSERKSLSEILSSKFLNNGEIPHYDKSFDEDDPLIHQSKVFESILSEGDFDPSSEVASKIMSLKVSGKNVPSEMLSQLSIKKLYFYEKKIILFLR
jgi:serine/threonine protein kinase